METHGKIKQRFSHPFPQGLENSEPTPLRVSHSSHSFYGWVDVPGTASKGRLRPIYLLWWLWKTLRQKRSEFPTATKAGNEKHYYKQT
jgi:hypothetical protein